MCGIAGGFSREQAFKLYESNLDRGKFSAGLLIAKNGKPTVIKSPEPFKLENVPVDQDIYLFHSCAPTGKNDGYTPLNVHPFCVNGVYVAHNGIITNADKLAHTYNIDYSVESASFVDSYVIPYIIAHNRKPDSYLWRDVILRSLKELRGTFGLWIHVEGCTFICRCGSTLYINAVDGSFSSSPQLGYTLIPDGRLYQVVAKRIQEVGIFEVKPTYFIAP
jgi:glucosamine 6-phosphate synthetase-like amidotransferase/phosphosugar isomerase protein